MTAPKPPSAANVEKAREWLAPHSLYVQARAESLAAELDAAEARGAKLNRPSFAYEEGYRRGVEDAAKECAEHSLHLGQSYAKYTAICLARKIRALLSPPKTSEASFVVIDDPTSRRAEAPTERGATPHCCSDKAVCISLSRPCPCQCEICYTSPTERGADSKTCPRCGGSGLLCVSHGLGVPMGVCGLTPCSSLRKPCPGCSAGGGR